MYSPNVMPKYLLGLSLILWGALNDRIILGVILAFFVEGSNFTSIRWNFGFRQLSRAWHLSLISTILAAATIWLEGNRYTALPTLMTWFPVLLLPLQFAQNYGLQSSIPVSIFSYYTRRMKTFAGSQEASSYDRRINFGNVYFISVIFASCLGTYASQWYFLPSLLIIVGLRLVTLPAVNKAWLFPIFFVGGLCSIAGQKSIDRFDHWLGGVFIPKALFDPNTIRTSIGTPGEVIQSPELLWRIQIKNGIEMPRLLRTGNYRQFLGTNWVNHRGVVEDFEDLSSMDIGGKAYYLLRSVEGAEIVKYLPSFEIRGGATEKDPLPVPGDISALCDFQLDGIESNSVGTIRVYPQHSVIRGEVRWGGNTNAEAPPDSVDDLRIPSSERIMLERVMARLGIYGDMELDEQLSLLKSWIFREFQYTRHPKIRMQPYLENQLSTLGMFLEEVKEGHCEYFATSAVLLLRAVGVPARYATGYAVVEHDSKRQEYLIRGTHAHAWCRVWDAKHSRWIDFDCTPPSWVALSKPRQSFSWNFNDWMKRIRQDFFLWRKMPENRLRVNLIFGMIAGLVIGFTFLRLWRSRLKHEILTKSPSFDGEVAITPLHHLGSHAEKLIGPRSISQSYAEWLDGLRDPVGIGSRFDEAIRLHQRMRFDTQPINKEDLDRLELLAQEIKKKLIGLLHSKRSKA